MFATIYLPNFYLQAAVRYDRTSRDKPVGLIEEQDRKPVIIELNAAAESAGVRKGMTPSQALARCLQVIIKARARSQETSIQETLLQSAFTLSPYIEETAPGIATVEFTDIRQSNAGAARTSDRNLRSKVHRVIESLSQSEIIAQAGIASSPDTSFLAAHLAQPILQIDNVKDFLAPLPIETLAIA
jgi:protein ImuB